MGSGSVLKRELADWLSALTESDQRNLEYPSLPVDAVPTRRAVDFTSQPVEGVSTQRQRWQRELSLHVFVYITCMGSRMDMHAYLLWGQ